METRGGDSLHHALARPPPRPRTPCNALGARGRRHNATHRREAASRALPAWLCKHGSARRQLVGGPRLAPTRQHPLRLTPACIIESCRARKEGGERYHLRPSLGQGAPHDLAAALTMNAFFQQAASNSTHNIVPRDEPPLSRKRRPPRTAARRPNTLAHQCVEGARADRDEPRPQAGIGSPRGRPR